MGNIVRETFYQNTSWICPAGVTSVDVVTVKNKRIGSRDIGSPVFAAPNIAIDVLGNAYSWGGNGAGQLGLGDTTPRSSPVAVLGGLSFVHACSDAGSSYALIASGSAYAWGTNSNGELGLGDVVVRSSPVAVLGGIKFSRLAIGSGGGNVAGITPGGKLYAWGANLNGQLGVGDVVPRSSPVAVLGGLTFQLFTNSLKFMAGLTTSGALYCWGVNANGQLGVGDVTPRSSPVAVLGGLTFQTMVQIGGPSGTSQSILALTTSGSMYAWGGNESGELGVGDVTPRSSPVAVLGGLTIFQIAASPEQDSQCAFALDSTGKAYGWGVNTKGVLGVGDSLARSSPVAVLGGLFFSSIFTTGEGQTFALTSNGTLYAWGQNTSGGLGVGDTVARSSPVAVLGGLSFVSVGSDFSSNIYGLTASGALYAWGANSNGELGLGDTTPRSSPVLVVGGLVLGSKPDVSITKVSVVPGTSYTITIQQYMASFGVNSVGQNNTEQPNLTLIYEQ